MTTSRGPVPGLVPRLGIFFVATTTAIYVIFEWIKYEFTLTPTSPPQPLPIRMIEWGPNLVTQSFALAAIVGTLGFLVQNSRRLFRKPTKCPSSSGLWRIAESAYSGMVAVAVYVLSAIVTFELWRLDFWTLQMCIVVGAQCPLFTVWRIVMRRNDLLD